MPATMLRDESLALFDDDEVPPRTCKPGLAFVPVKTSMRNLAKQRANCKI